MDTHYGTCAQCHRPIQLICQRGTGYCSANCADGYPKPESVSINKENTNP